jgi:ABC-type multidrug transport system fused ATPase/permease subunit
MSLLGIINPNLTQSRSVVSHNIPQLQERHETTFTPQTQRNRSEKSEDGLTLHEDEQEKMESRIGALARRLTRHSTQYSVSSGLENPFTSDATDSTVSPHSPNFNVRSWMKMLLAIRSRDPDRYPDRTAGVAFRNLSVHGFGSPTDYQKDVLNCLLEAGTIMRRLAGIKMPRIEILRSFDGLVKSGEMLIVLGKPGSGCSTLLKTIAGEMNGISLSEDSVLNYQGKYQPRKQHVDWLTNVFG